VVRGRLARLEPLELVLLEAAVPESRRDCARGLRDVPD